MLSLCRWTCCLLEHRHPTSGYPIPRPGHSSHPYQFLKFHAQLPLSSPRFSTHLHFDTPLWIAQVYSLPQTPTSLSDLRALCLNYSEREEKEKERRQELHPFDRSESCSYPVRSLHLGTSCLILSDKILD